MIFDVRLKLIMKTARVEPLNISITYRSFLEHRQKQLEEQGRLGNAGSFGNTLVEMERLRNAVANGGYRKYTDILIKLF